MITVYLNGGLGNQMFQFAAAYALSKKNKRKIKLNLSNYNINSRNFELNIFNLDSREILISDKKTILGKYIWKLVEHKLLFFFKNVFFERYNFVFDSSFFELSGNAHLFGYFQSEKYFNFIRDDIIKIFKFKRTSDPNYLEVVRKIKASNSVSVHIRRGDYVLNKSANAFHGVLPIAYYKKAINLIKAHVFKPKLFLFTDDPEWVRKNFNFLGRFELIDINRGELSYRDMELMSLCKHNIIANSSFSWWGAWLNLNQDKIVVAPKKWLRDESVPLNDIIPDSWLTL
jgi:hypothetical protein